MENSLLKYSVFVHRLVSLLCAIRGIWKHSILLRIVKGIHNSYQFSMIRSGWETFCSVPDTSSVSMYGRAMFKLGLALERFGHLIHHSGFYKTVSRFRVDLHLWLLVAFVFYLPLEFVVRKYIAIPILASLWEEAFIAAAFILILWRRALRGGETGTVLSRTTSLDAYMLLFMGVGLMLMSIVDPWPAVALAGYRATVVYMVWFFLLIRLLENRRDFKIVYYGFLILGGLLCLHGIYQYIVGVPIPANWVSQTEMGVRTRVFSITGSPNIFGSLIVMIAPMAAAMIYYCRNIWWKLFFLAVTGMMCLCLLFTFSRGAWVGMVVAVILFALYLDRRLLGILAGAVALVLVLVPSITSRLTYLFTSDYAAASAVGGRTLRWEVGRLLLTENNPWLGFGLGRFGGAVAMNNKVLIETEEFKYFYMDNYYLKIMVEMGYIGIFFFLLMLAGLVIWGLRAVYQSGPAFESGLAFETGQAFNSGPAFETGHDPLVRAAGNPKALAVGIFSGLIGVLVHCYFENIFEEPYMMAYFWGLAAMLIYLGFFAQCRRPG